MNWFRSASLALTVAAAACGPAAVPMAPVPDPPQEQQPAKPASAPEPAKPPAEPAPAQLGSPAASKAAAPGWWMRWPRIKQRPEYAPQPHSPGELFDAADEKPGQLESIADALLACRLEAGKFFEKKGVQLIEPGAFAEADLLAAAAVKPASSAPGLVTTARGKEDTNRMFFTVPLAKMARGDALVINVFDRDVMTVKAIEQLTLAFDGATPIRARGERAAAECRVLPRPWLEAQLAEKLKKLDAELETYDDRYHPHLPGRGLTHEIGPAAHGDFLRGRIDQAAALVGWDDPRINKRVKRLQAIVARFDAELKRLLHQTRATLPAPGAWATMLDGELQAKQVKKLCGKRKLGPYRRLYARGLDKKARAALADDCVFHVRWRNAASPGPIALSVFSHNLGKRLEDFRLIRVDGVAEKARAVGVVGRRGRVVDPQDDPVLKPGDEAEAVYVAPADGTYLLQGRYDRRRVKITRDGWAPLDEGRLALQLAGLICGDELKKQEKEYVYPMPGVNYLKNIGCVVLARVQNRGKQALLVRDDPALGRVKQLEFLTGDPVTIKLEPYATLAGSKVEKLPHVSGKGAQLELGPGAEATVLLRPSDSLEEKGVKADTAALLLRATFGARRASHLRLE